MGEGNVEIVRRIWQAAERRDHDTVLALYDPSVVWDATRIPGPLADIYRGRGGDQRHAREWREAFETHQVRAESIIDAGDAVLVGFRSSGRGRTSGAHVEMSRWLLYRLRGGRVARVDVFEHEAEAREAVG